MVTCGTTFSCLVCITHFFMRAQEGQQGNPEFWLANTSIVPLSQANFGKAWSLVPRSEVGVADALWRSHCLGLGLLAWQPGYKTKPRPLVRFPGFFLVGVKCRKTTYSLPEFMNFKLVGKTILVVNIKFGPFLGHPLSQ